MPEVMVDSRNSKATAGPAERRGRSSSLGMILLGVLLLILALLMLLFVLLNIPQTQNINDNKRPEHIQPGAQPKNSPLLPSPTPTNTTGRKNDSRDTVPRQYASHGFRRQTAALTPTAQDSPQQSAQPGTRCTQVKEKKPGFLGRFFDWLARVFTNRKLKPPNAPPTITLSASSANIMRNCPPSQTEPGTSASDQIQLTANASDPDGDTLLYTYSTTGGQITGDGPNVSWSLAGVTPGTYTATVEVDDGRGCVSFSSTTVSVGECQAAQTCATVTIDCPTQLVEPGQRATVIADVSGGPPGAHLSYVWSVSAGRIISGQGTASIAVDTTSEDGQTITATVEVGGLAPECQRTGNCTFTVAPSRQPSPTGTLTGRVREGGGAPAKVQVIAIDQNGKVWDAVWTDESGNFIFKGIPAGRYRFEILTAAGNSTRVEQEVQVDAGQTASTSIELGPPIVTPSPRPSLSPQASPSPSPSPQASPKPSMLPSASPSPYPDSSDTQEEKEEQDRITGQYPDRFLKDTDGEVTLALERIKGRVIPSETTNTNQTHTVIDVPGPIEGASSGQITPEVNEADYDTYAVVRLIPTGLVKTWEEEKLEKLYDGKKVEWRWKLRPADNVGEKASFYFQMDVIWRANKPGITPDIIRRTNVWPNGPYEVHIGPPVSVMVTAGLGSPLFAAGGIAAIGSGRRRRRGLTDEDIEEEGIEDTPGMLGIDAAQEVTSSIYAPSEAQTGEPFLVQVFAHLAEEAAGLAEIAKGAQADARWRGAARLKEAIKQGTELTFSLSMQGLVIDEPTQSREWRGETEQIAFEVRVPPDCQPGNFGGTVTVSRQSVPIGHLKFIIKIIGKALAVSPAVEQAPVAGTEFVRYRRAFISYTTRDRREVLKRVQSLEAVGIDYFQDLLKLRPGDKWEKLIYEYIDKSDVFLLFWSRAASESQWVKKEVLHALERKAGQEMAPPEIRPIILEAPPAQPPDELGSIHFNDQIAYLISATSPWAHFWWLIRNNLLFSSIASFFRRSD